MRMIKNAIKKIVDGNDLCQQEIMEAMDCIMEGQATPAQIGSFITALRVKGETIDEITGCAKIMRKKSEKIYPKISYSIDTCGTGGDGSNTFNISTATAIAAAAGGVVVAKHGNRSVSSRSGSADVLEALGININLTPEQVKHCIENIGIGFMYAPSFHKSMKYAAGARQELGIRTIFNILGPLTNPSNAKGQVLGVYEKKLTELMANVLKKLNIERAMVVHGTDGMDEISITSETLVSELKDGKVINYSIHPEQFNIKVSSKEELLGGDSKRNAEIITAIFNGEKGPGRDIVLLNTAAALYIGKAVESLAHGIEMSREVIDSGKAITKLQELKSFTNRFAS